MTSRSVHLSRIARAIRAGFLVAGTLVFASLQYLSTSNIPLFVDSGMGCGRPHNYSYFPVGGPSGRVLVYLQPVLQFPLHTVQKIAFCAYEVGGPSGWRASLIQLLYPLYTHADDESFRISYAWITALNLGCQGLALGLVVAAILAVRRYEGGYRLRKATAA